MEDNGANGMISFYWKIVLVGIPLAVLRDNWKKVSLAILIVGYVLFGRNQVLRKEVLAESAPQTMELVATPDRYLQNGSFFTLVELIRRDDSKCDAPTRFARSLKSDGTENHVIICEGQSERKLITVRETPGGWLVVGEVQ